MAYNYPEIRKFQGLFLQANTFEVPDGAMEEARNVVIKNDDTLSKIRGNYTYYSPSGPILNQLFFYRERLLAAFSTKVSYFTDTGTAPNETGTITDLTGETVAITSPRVSRSVEANSNLYFTTDTGVLKLEDYNSNVFISGVPQGLDLSLLLLATSLGVISANSSVSYRVLFGRRDANNNLLLSAPSNIGTIYTGEEGTGVTYSSSGGGPYTVTVTNSGHGLSSGQEIIVSGATDADADGTHVITVTSSSQFTYSTVGNPASGTLNYTFTRNVRIELSIPSEIDSSSDGYFFQVYRSSEATGNVTPPLDFKLVTERTLTSSEITNQVAFFDDDVDSILLGAELYTNPNSREGELQANFRPPKCEDVAFYKNYVFYANCESRKILQFEIIDASSLVNDDYIEVRSGSVTRRYVARVGVGNQTVFSQSVSNAAGDLRIDYANHGFSDGDSIYISSVAGGTLTSGTYFVISSASGNFEISQTFGGSPVPYNSETQVEFQGVIHPTSAAALSWSRTSGTVTVTSASHGLQSGMTIAVTASSGGTPNITLANYVITVTGANTFTFTENVANSSGTMSYRVNNYMFQLDNSSASISLQLRETAQGIVKAINRDPLSLLYANYISTSETTTPGQMRLLAKGFIDPIFMRANTVTVGESFLPVLPTSYSSGQQVSSTNDEEGNVAYVSKIGEPEAVPLLNKFAMGARTKPILRVMALRDSVIFVKADGIYRLTGDVIENFTITVLDSTVICVATSSVKLLNNEVILLSNQGVCRISESSVQIVSRRIDDVIQPILGKPTLEVETSAISSESERLYYLTTVMPNSTEADETYVYNVLNSTWTNGSQLIKQGLVGPEDTIYFISTENKIQRERKSQTKVDFSGQNYSISVLTVAADNLTATISSPQALPEEGDMAVQDDIISRFDTVRNISGSTYEVTFGFPTNLEVSDTPTLYKRIVSEVKFSPFHAGMVGRMKQFGQIILTPRNDSCSKLTLSFVSYLFGGSGLIEWSKLNVIDAEIQGWGNEPWGLFPWGLTETIDTIIGTQPDIPIRIYIPLYQQRATWIQTEFVHSEAGEAINLQAVSYAVRAYQERVVR